MSLLDELFGPDNLPLGRVRLGIYASSGSRIMERDFGNRYDLYQYLLHAEIFLSGQASRLSLQLVTEGSLLYRSCTYRVLQQ